MTSDGSAGKIPSVEIAMALYEPNRVWLREQLCSLNAQTYPDLRLLVWNDGSPSSELSEMFRACVTRFPFTILQGGRRLGSNGAFAALTRRSRADYIAYCDQDDRWLPDKIRLLVRTALAREADLVCSDAYVIDARGGRVADSIVYAHPRQKFYAGANVPGYLLTRNFVMGCTALVKRETAQRSLPFPRFLVHDWWLAVYVSAHGRLAVAPEPLIEYRVHAENQTGILRGIATKRDYYAKRILPYKRRLREIRARIPDAAFGGQMERCMRWADCRARYFRSRGFGAFWEMLMCLPLDYHVALFELCLKWMPSRLFSYAVAKIREGKW